jgi:hypothetical protein
MMRKWKSGKVGGGGARKIAVSKKGGYGTPGVVNPINLYLVVIKVAYDTL